MSRTGIDLAAVDVIGVELAAVDVTGVDRTGSWTSVIPVTEALTRVVSSIPGLDVTGTTSRENLI